MSIKVLNEIPQTLQEKRESYRQMIRNDIQEAIDNHIERFEFEGDYNWKYLANYAREEADGIYRNTLYYPTARKIRKVLKERDPDTRCFSIPSPFETKREYIKIKSLKGDDRIHVYCEIDFAFAENFFETLMKRTEEREKEYAERKAQRERIRNGERAKHLEEGNTDTD